jgi:hypothetical protein
VQNRDAYADIYRKLKAGVRIRRVLYLSDVKGNLNGWTLFLKIPNIKLHDNWFVDRELL